MTQLSQESSSESGEGLKFGLGYVQLTLHLVDGGTHRFTQADLQTAQTLLDHLRPERFFSQKRIIIAGNDAVTVLATDSVERIDLRCNPLPDWQHGVGVSDIREVGEEGFVRIRRQHHLAPPYDETPAGITAPPPIEIGVAVELRSGATVYLSAHPRPPQQGRGAALLTPDDARSFLQHLFDQPILFGRTADDSALLLINPANAVRFTLAPPPPVQSLPSVWTMEGEAR